MATKVRVFTRHVSTRLKTYVGQPDFSKNADDDGEFRRKASTFRNSISRDPNSRFPAEKDRYALYLNLGCPWAHRANLVRSLKGLEPYIQLILCDPEFTKEGWRFTGKNGSESKDPLYGFTTMGELYRKADPEYQGRFTVPTLWDKKTETIVNNESSEIIRMFYTEFDNLLPDHLKEVNKPGGGFYPSKLRKEIDELNTWVYDTVNNGVYKTGFATTQEVYESHLFRLFESLDRLEKHLGEPGHSPYLFGEHVTDADIRLYTTLIRFDVAYYDLFLCNLKMIRYDYPRLSRWLRNLYWDGGHVQNGAAFKDTVNFWQVSRHPKSTDLECILIYFSINWATLQPKIWARQSPPRLSPKAHTQIFSHCKVLKCWMAEYLRERTP